jgi:gluconate 2-dehydrogenase gamma chain
VKEEPELTAGALPVEVEGGSAGEPAALPIDRRELLRRAGSVTVAASFALSGAAAEAAHQHVTKQKATAAAPGKPAASGKPAAPRLFDAREWASVRVLCDLVIPADERSGSATEALVPEFIDYVLTDPLTDPRERETLQTQVRGGLAWLDRECAARFGRGFVDCADGERKAVLDSIAWPEKARPGMEAGASFFTLFRDLVASGYWTSRIGTEDLRYLGNTYVAEWKGCPPEVLSRLGLGDR